MEKDGRIVEQRRLCCPSSFFVVCNLFSEQNDTRTRHPAGYGRNVTEAKGQKTTKISAYTVHDGIHINNYCISYWCSWWCSIVVRTSVLAGELSLSCARLMDGRLTTLWVKRPLSVNQQGQLSLPFLRGRLNE